jgi:hypothetical protein
MKLNGVEQMSKHKPYYGAARFVEIAPPGIAYRGFANVDHITNISFGEERKDVDIPQTDEEFEKDPEGKRIKTENQVIGFNVSLSIGGEQSKFTFNDIDIAMYFYNSILTRISGLVPCDMLPALRPPAEPTIEEAALEAAMDELPPMSDEELVALAEDEPMNVLPDLDDDETKH